MSDDNFARALASASARALRCELIQEDARETLHKLTFEAFLDTIDVRPSTAIRAIARAIDGRPLEGLLTDEECEALFGCYPEGLPRSPPAIIAGRAGRRGGKSSRLVATLALYQAFTAPLDLLAAAERAYALIIAPTKSLAIQSLSFVRSWLLHPVLAPHVVRERGRAEPSAESEAATSPERVMIRRPHDGKLVELRVVAAASGGTGARSRTCVFFALDEASFFRADAEYSVNDTEIFRAALPALVPGGRAALVSTPWIEGVGVLEERLTADYGRHRTTLCFTATTRALNPAWDPTGALEEILREDIDNHAREILAVPLPASSALFFPPDVVDGCFLDDVELPPNGAVHWAGVDLGFRRNSSAIAISRLEDARATMAYLEGLRPRDFGGRLQPSAVVNRFALACVRYNAASMRGDLVGADVAAEELAKASAPRNLRGFSVCYEELEQTASANSERMAEFRRRMIEGQVRLVRSPRLRSQFLRTTWRPGDGGVVKIVLPRSAGEHGDELIAACNSIVAVPLGHRALDAAAILRRPEGTVERPRSNATITSPEERATGGARPSSGSVFGDLLGGGRGGY